MALAATFEGDALGRVTELADRIYADVRAAAARGGVSPDSIVGILTLAMEGAAAARWLTGPQKKCVVLHVAARLAREIPNENARAAVLAGLTLLGPSIVDGLYLAATEGISVRGRRWICCG